GSGLDRGSGRVRPAPARHPAGRGARGRPGLAGVELRRTLWGWLPGGRLSRPYPRVIALLANPEQSRHRTDGHPERPERVTATLEAIAASELGLTVEPGPSAPDAAVHRVHDPRYVAMLDRAAASGGGYLDADTYITPDSMVAARTAAGAVVEGVDRVLDGRARHALAVWRPPGHHAEHARAMGFCLLHNCC